MMAAERLLWLDECERHGADPALAADGFLIADKDEVPLARHLNVIVPVSFACVGAMTVMSVYPSIRSVILPHFEKYRSHNALFSEEAFASLDRALRPYLSGWGYKPAMFPARYGVSLLQDDPSAVPSDVLDGTHRMTAALQYTKNHTSMHPADCILRGAYAQIVGGEIVCIAAVNRVSGVERCVEIGVECAPAWRRQGYARSCIRALTRELSEDGKVVLYRHYHTNIGSAAVAKSAAFRPAGRFFAYTSFAM